MYIEFIIYLCIGMAGLAVTYGLNLNARLSRWILSFCKLENKIISIERIYQYSQIPSEAPTFIEDAHPPSSWPENGTIEINNLKVHQKFPSVKLFCIALYSYSPFFFFWYKGSLWRESTNCSSWNQLCVPWWQEDWDSGAHWKWQINSDPSAIPADRAICRADNH